MSSQLALTQLRCEVLPDQEGAVVALSGELDLSSVPEVRSSIDELIDAGSAAIAVDLRGLTFIDSTGLHLLLAASESAREHDCAFTLIPGRDAIQRAFSLTGLDARLVFESAERNR